MDTSNGDDDDFTAKSSGESMAPAELIGVVGDIASAFLSNPSSRVDISQIPEVIGNIAKSLQDVLPARNKPAAPTDTAAPVPAVPPKKSVFPDNIICLECGGGYKMMKRHIEIVHGLTPNEYRIKWSLPGDYPLVAPDHAAHRSQIAKDSGLGSKPAAPRQKSKRPKAES